LGDDETKHIPSNIVHVRIKQPVGIDAKVWQELNNPALLTFLQTESAAETPLEVPLKIANLLHNYSDSGYAPGLRLVLSKVAPELRDKLAFAEAKHWGEMLGIKGFARLEDDPADKRLEATRKDSFEQEMTVEQVLRSLSRSSGVKLDAPPAIKAKTLRIADSVASVRACMRILRRGLDASWERRGDGYFLTPNEPIAGAPKNDKAQPPP
jgi:hypothetical protein